MRNIAEGANRVHPRDKAARFIVALGEVGECEAALEMAQLLELAPWSKVGRMRRTASRVAALDLRVTERISGEEIARRVRPHVA